MEQNGSLTLKGYSVRLSLFFLFCEKICHLWLIGRDFSFFCLPWLWWGLSGLRWGFPGLWWGCIYNNIWIRFTLWSKNFELVARLIVWKEPRFIVIRIIWRNINFVVKFIVRWRNGNMMNYLLIEFVYRVSMIDKTQNKMGNKSSSITLKYIFKTE